jgi:molybdopterin synthase catalytic subunit
MDQARINEIIQRRRGRYTAQTLARFEEIIESHLPREAAGAIQDFKGLVRERFDAFAVDASELIGLLESGAEQNGAAIELRDRAQA